MPVGRSRRGTLIEVHTVVDVGGLIRSRAAALWGDRVATGHAGGDRIRLWSLRDGGEAAGALRGLMSFSCPLAVVGGSTAQRLLASGSEDHSVRLWDIDAGTCTAVLNGHTEQSKLSGLPGWWAAAVGVSGRICTGVEHGDGGLPGGGAERARSWR